MNLFTQRVLFFAALLGLSSCGMIGEEAVSLPAYICVPSYTFETDSMIQGSNHNNFSDMWISDAGIIVGAVGLPSLLPIQKQGPTEVRVDAGILLTGQDHQRSSYPLIATYIETRDLKPGVIDTFRPVFKYLPNLDVKFVEDYDRIGASLKINPSYYQTGDTILKVNDEHALRPGSYSGKVVLASSHQIMQLISSAEYEFVGSGSPVYLEIDYNSNLPLDIGYYYNDPITGASPAQSVIQTYASNGWRKLYIDLTSEVATKKAKTTFIIYIGIYNIDNIAPAVYIDNVKLLCLKG
jgi:hypothetical protein